MDIKYALAIFLLFGAPVIDAAVNGSDNDGCHYVEYC